MQIQLVCQFVSSTQFNDNIQPSDEKFQTVYLVHKTKEYAVLNSIIILFKPFFPFITTITVYYLEVFGMDRVWNLLILINFSNLQSTGDDLIQESNDILLLKISIKEISELIQSSCTTIHPCHTASFLTKLYFCATGAWQYLEGRNLRVWDKSPSNDEK